MLVQAIEGDIAASLRDPLAAGRKAAESGAAATHRYLADPANEAEIACALRIRAVENGLYTLFGKGRLHGTIHTCIGQEFSAAIIGKHLRADDYVTSNHRCHGHFIAATGDWRGLIDEIVGNQDGVCAGIGSSQHLWARNFISNGQQGGLLPVAAGVALDRKLKRRSDIVVSFMGEGTAGEGVLYETMNLDALWGLPHIIVCENNFYSQSTPQAKSVAGELAKRGIAFGLPECRADSWNLAHFDEIVAGCVARARNTSLPSFLTLASYRLNPHSKGDDQRDRSEIEWFRERDPVTRAVEDYTRFRDLYESYVAETADFIEQSLAKPGLAPSRYGATQLPQPTQNTSWTTLPSPAEDAPRLAGQLNEFYRTWLDRNADAVFLGEDIDDPYGGAFKISKGLSTAFGERVRTTPISEAAITGIGIGLAVAGRRSFVEIMFGDFITYSYDQIINNAAKFFHIYNGNLDCPVIIRTPMGGRRGYGPTHSQSLERFLIGIDNCCCISLNSLADVGPQLAGLAELRCPVILLENKSDYTAKPFAPQPGVLVEKDHALFPTLRVRPARTGADVTLLAYGGMARFLANSLLDIFEQTDSVPEMIVPTQLFPLDLAPIRESVARTGRLVIVEEGGNFGSFGAELIAQLHEAPDLPFAVARVGGKPVPVPSAPQLEAAALPSIDAVCTAIRKLGQPA